MSTTIDNFSLSIQSCSSVVPSNLILRIQFLQSHCYNTLHIHPSSTRCGSVKLLFSVPAPRVKPERQMKEWNTEAGRCFRDSLYMHRGSASRIVLRDESRIVEQQKQQHSSSSTAAVVAATSSCCFWSQHPGSNQNGK